jgi:SAM-dependent methyltransferase
VSPTANGRFWRWYAKVYDLIWDSTLTAALCERAFGDLPTRRTAVDLGCGTGLTSRPLTDAGCEVVGVDLSADMLAIAERSGRVARTMLGDAASTGLPPHAFDIVVACNLLHLHPDPNAVLAEMSRLAAPGGAIVCSWPSNRASLTGTFVREVRSGRPVMDAGRALALRTAVGIGGLLTRARLHPSGVVDAAVSQWARACGATRVAWQEVMSSAVVAVFRTMPMPQPLGRATAPS